MPDNEFAEMLATFDRWIATQERDGWASPDVENYAGRVRKGLWVCAKNNPAPRAIAYGLAEDIEALAKAIGERQHSHHKRDEMNHVLLKLTQRNLSSWLTKCREETVSADKKLEIIMHSLSDICTALGTDGTQESINKWYEED